MENEKLQEICDHAVREYPGECCGLLFGDQESGKVWEIHWTENAETPERQTAHFLIDPLVLYRAERDAEKKGMEIVGFYHSHADHPATLSEEDRSYMAAGFLYLIVSVQNGICTEIKTYRKTGFRNMAREIKWEGLEGKGE